MMHELLQPGGTPISERGKLCPSWNGNGPDQLPGKFVAI